MSVRNIAIVVVIALSIAAFFAFDLHRFLTLEYLDAVSGAARGFVAERPLVAGASFFALYVLVTGLSLPGATVMTLAAGVVFGLWWGLLLVSFASALGATIAFAVSRTLLRDWVQERFAARLEAINRGFERDGSFYLFSLRMVPVFPFFVINLVMGITPIGVLPFYLVSQLGMLPGTLVYVFAGTQIGAIESMEDILSPGLIIAFSLLGLFPLAARKLMERIRGRPVDAETPGEAGKEGRT